MKRRRYWQLWCLFALLAGSLQSCLGLGGNNTSDIFQTTNTKSGAIGINKTVQAAFGSPVQLTDAAIGQLDTDSRPFWTP